MNKITVDNWQQYRETYEKQGNAAMMSYCDAVAEEVRDIDQILLCNSFEEMKQKLTLLREERANFTNHVHEHLDDKKPRRKTSKSQLE